MRYDITYIGLDAHKNAIVAYALPPCERIRHSNPPPA